VGDQSGKTKEGGIDGQTSTGSRTVIFVLCKSPKSRKGFSESREVDSVIGVQVIYSDVDRYQNMYQNRFECQDYELMREIALGTLHSSKNAL
jgi:hypothetical protein